MKAAIENLLTDDRCRGGARRVAADIAAMPSPDEVASVLTARFGRG
jgi:UDP:flavonoid glycosyltransferase YjiC (YdhE family)